MTRFDCAYIRVTAVPCFRFWWICQWSDTSHLHSLSLFLGSQAAIQWQQSGLPVVCLCNGLFFYFTSLQLFSQTSTLIWTQTSVLTYFLFSCRKHFLLSLPEPHAIKNLIATWRSTECLPSQPITRTDLNIQRDWSINVIRIELALYRLTVGAELD